MTFVAIGLDDKSHRMSVEEYLEIEKKHVKRIKGNIYEVKGMIKFEDDSTIGVYSKEGIRVLLLTCIEDYEIEEFKKFEGKIVKFQMVRVEKDDEIYNIPRLPRKN